MSDSGQSTTERARVRKQQRSLAKNISEAGEDLGDVRKTAFEELREDNNEIFNKVYYAREAALDGENMASIAKAASKQASNIWKVPRYDVDRVCLALRRKCEFENGGMDWAKLGVAVGKCFNTVPVSCSFLRGQIGGVVDARKERTVKRKRVQETAEEEHPEDLLTMKKVRRASPF